MITWNLPSKLRLMVQRDMVELGLQLLCDLDRVGLRRVHVDLRQHCFALRLLPCEVGLESMGFRARPLRW